MTNTPDQDPSGSTPEAAGAEQVSMPAPSVTPPAAQQPTQDQPTQDQPTQEQPTQQLPTGVQPGVMPAAPGALPNALPAQPYGSAPVQETPQVPGGYAAQQPGGVQAGYPSYAAAHQQPGAAYQQHSQPEQGSFGQPIQPEQAAFQQPSVQAPESPVSAQPKSRSGALLAGLAIGALVGGIVGGGVAAVVASNVSTPSVAQGGGTLTLNNPDSATTVSGVAAVATPSVVTLEVSGPGASGSGSGVIYSEDGYIITNAHVVTLNVAGNDDTEIRVKLSDGRILDGALVGYDAYADIAVVKVEAESLPAVTVADSSELNVGDLTVAIGAPLNLPNTVTSGVVSALDRGISVGSQLIPQEPSAPQEGEEDEGTTPWDFRFGNPNDGQTEAPQQATGGTVTLPVIQTDASINPGNSGGALLNSNGELIGINVAIASTGGSSDTAGSVGLGFAIPSNLATRVADALIAGERPSHGLLGASVVNSSLATDGSRDVAGGLIMEISPGGAAEKAGLRKGDVITAIDGVPAADGTSVSALVRVHPGNTTVKIEYSRDGKMQETEATLGNLSE